MAVVLEAIMNGYGCTSEVTVSVNTVWPPTIVIIGGPSHAASRRSTS